ncbi:hypothetical protein [Pedobacter soli]|uniref:Uncharacterized protein n=1 Tax=Pedobacter soli TaxID=390242 RepID=A0A1G6WNX8_9SPHI|nr:hypothetical protein [Pedobacter soli]SDD67373.1 hypothetical protein SAMN04488024_10773 [Pedobacter soli]
MFEKICIKSKERGNENLDVSFLIDSMLFYGNIVVLVHKAELVILLKYFGEDFLKELIQSGRLTLRIRENILGSMIFDGDRYGIQLWAAQNETASGILYQAHREFVSNSAKNMKFSDELSKITEPFRYDTEIVDQIKSDFENEQLLKKLLPIYLTSQLPEFELPAQLEIGIVKDGSFGPFDAFSLKTNLDIKNYNTMSKKVKGDTHFDFNYSGFLLALSESKGDIFIASHFESELVTTTLYSDFINQQFEDIIQRRTNSQENLDLFGEYVLADCHSIGDAFIQGIITPKDLIGLLEKADKFREWLAKVPEDKSFIGEYYKESTRETFVDKLPVKATRFMIFEGIGITLDVMGAGGVGTAIGTGLSLIDEFFLDKLIKGWKPNHFIDDNLIPKTKKDK